jgi:hypothetical protein
VETRLQRLQAPEAIAESRRELAALSATVADVEAEYPDIAALKNDLRAVNEALWDIENAMRTKEASASFDQGFIDLARSINLRNDQRTHLKQTIDRLFDPQPLALAKDAALD